MNFNTNEILIRLSVIEERINNSSESLSRIHKQMQDIDTRLELIEKQEPMQTLASKWIISAVWTVAGLAAYMAAKFLGLM
jgi:hypothetical protein